MPPRRKPKDPQKKPAQVDHGIIVKVETFGDEIGLIAKPEIIGEDAYTFHISKKMKNIVEKPTRPKRIIRKSRKYADSSDDDEINTAMQLVMKMDKAEKNNKKITKNTTSTIKMNDETAIVEIMEQKYDSDSSGFGFKDDSGDEDFSIYEDKKPRATKFRKQTKSRKKDKQHKIEEGIIDTRMFERPGESMEKLEYKELTNIESITQIPRSTENSKFKDVYKTLPKLRSSSPPRFTTKGVKKIRLDAEELGIRIVGRTLGNPFSSHHKRRNGVVFGNQTLKTVEDLEKYTGAAINVRQAVRRQAVNVRISSYVQPKILDEVKKQNGFFKQSAIKENVDNVDEETEVDIETPDDANMRKGLIKGKGGVKGGGRRPGRTILECKECGYKTTHSGHMKIHIISVHKDLKLHACKFPGCNYKCARKGSMTRHEKCVHRKDRVLKCDQCSFESAWSVSLERHIITRHLKLRPWTCEVCKKSFGQQFTLTQHMTTVHKKIRRIRCAFCSYRASTKVNVRQHILRMHREEIQESMDGEEEEEEEEEVERKEKEEVNEEERKEEEMERKEEEEKKEQEEDDEEEVDVTA